VRWAVVPSPIGDLGVAVDDSGVCRVHFGWSASSETPPAAPAPEQLLTEVADQLRAYFAGERTAFDLPLSVHGGSGFERAVWGELAGIPYGEMRTYGQIAAAVGDRDAARAVGIACNHNPIAIVLPCHRVVGADGKLVGFGGGLPRKRFLLELEARVRIERDFSSA
jgi:methylated-DNA-[protein]-cysteine S-methyltransferase